MQARIICKQVKLLFFRYYQQKANGVRCYCCTNKYTIRIRSACQYAWL